MTRAWTSNFFADKQKGAVAVDRHSGARIRIERVNNVFEIEAAVTPWQGGSGQA